MSMGRIFENNAKKQSHSLTIFMLLNVMGFLLQQ